MRNPTVKAEVTRPATRSRAFLLTYPVPPGVRHPVLQGQHRARGQGPDAPHRADAPDSPPLQRALRPRSRARRTAERCAGHPRPGRPQDVEEHGNAISLSATDAETAKLIKKSQTDADRNITYDPEGRPGVSALLTTAALCTGRTEADIAAEIGDGGGHPRKYVTESVNATWPPSANAARSCWATWATSRTCCTRATAAPTR